MSGMKSWMLGAALVAGSLGVGATAAQAAEWGVYVGGPTRYMPPCPGPGFVWMDGYMADGYWVPGRWEFRGAVEPRAFGYYEGRRDWDGDRGWGRERERAWDRGRDDDRGRGWGRGWGRGRVEGREGRRDRW